MIYNQNVCFFFFSSRRRHTRYWRDWSSDVCSSDLKSANRTLLWARIGWQNRHTIQNKAKHLAVRIVQGFGYYCSGLSFFLCLFVVETEGQLLHFAETVLHIHVNRLAVCGE